MPLMDSAEAQRITVVIADDHDLVRMAMKALLETIPGVQVLAEARSGDELLALLRTVRPQVVMTDISMPGLDGIAAIAALRAEHGALPVLVLSMHGTQDVIKRAVAAGANGYLLKSASKQELEQALRTVVGTGSWFSGELARLLLEKGEPTPTELLTARQVEILTLLAGGNSSKEIAFALGLSSKTVDMHRARIMERLGIADLAGLTRYAVRHGLVQL